MRDALPISSVPILSEIDVVLCRQRAKQIAGWVGMSQLEQIRLATGVSELARNIFQYASQGRFNFYLQRDARGQLNGIAFDAIDQGKGIAQLQEILDGSYVSTTGMGVGLVGAKRLMDDFQIESSTNGTRIRAIKYMGQPRPFPDEAQIVAFRQQLSAGGELDPYRELQLQSEDLLLTNNELRIRQQELEDTAQELENTNKGVVALYSELEKTAQELKEAGESKSRFFSNMTHEFRTPINIIENISKLLASGVDGQLNAEQLKQVKFISDAAAELANLITELLDLAEVQSGRIEIAPTRFSLFAFMEEIETLTTSLAIRYPGVTPLIQLPTSDVSLNTDHGRLFQILRNLISNAFKYTPAGNVKIKVFQPDDAHLEFLVEDTGIGISAENQARVFEEFCRIKSPNLKNIEGTGLGLPLAQKLATLLNGRISLSSREGQGSRFYVQIPLELDGEESDGRDLDLSGTTILIIDDSDADRYLIRRTLEPYDPVLIEADSARASIDKLNAVRPDIIFLDLELPDISGEDLLASMDWSMHQRVVINTAKPLGDEERARLEPHCHALLLKTQADYSERLLQCVRALAWRQE
ncbi:MULTISPECIES: ATP-binding protein [Pseudomonas]|uniref:ATP-binding response regulator n=1 Tax=Pseudomonas TaxID=286 RepID=UPI00249C0F4B|nr:MULTISPECIES: ATP-binding protein [Pseudomonas]